MKCTCSKKAYAKPAKDIKQFELHLLTQKLRFTEDELMELRDRFEIILLLIHLFIEMH